MLEDRSKIVVQKYGGSSVASIEKLKQVAKQVADTKKRGLQVVVVVSAMGKTTDEFLKLSQQMSPHPARRELDMLLSTGERISMALLAMALHDLGVDAISLTGSQSGILTNDRHSGARIIEVRPIRIEDELAKDKVVIVAGFQGMSYKREITTLGRGGSDTTAVALAAALGAFACEIYSDVDGIYSADPRVVQNAKHLPEISYEEMQELAEHGAKVLNAQAVSWAKKAGIVIYARKTGHQVGDRETAVFHPLHSRSLNQQVTAITGTPQVVCIDCKKNGDQALTLLEEHQVYFRHSKLLFEGMTSVFQATLVQDDLPDFASVLKALENLGCHPQVDESLGTMTLVGIGIGSDAMFLGKTIQLLRQKGFTVQSMDASPLRVCFWLPQQQIHEATRLLHSALLE